MLDQTHNINLKLHKDKKMVEITGVIDLRELTMNLYDKNNKDIKYEYMAKNRPSAENCF